MTGAAPWRREEGGVLVLALHVQPGAKRTAVDGTHGEGTQQRLKVRLAAPPVDGKANAELIELVARRFGCAKSAVSIKTGAGSKLKRVTVPD